MGRVPTRKKSHNSSPAAQDNKKSRITLVSEFSFSK